MPWLHQQAVGRLHRVGGKQVVTIHDVIVPEIFEPYAKRVAADRLQFAESIPKRVRALAWKDLFDGE